MTKVMKAFIYGSCVTRDSVEHWEDYGLELAGYIARQSIISAYSPANPEQFATGQIPSAFQRNMIDGDIASNLPAAITKQRANYDLIIWDLTDERAGIMEVPTGGHVTHLKDYKEGAYIGADPLVIGPRFGSDTHYRDWTAAADKFLADLDSVGALDSLVVNAIPWAERLDTGELIDSGPTAGWFNPQAARYFDHLESAGVRIARTDQSLVAAKSDHQWGLNAYHFTDDSYRASLDAITAAMR